MYIFEILAKLLSKNKNKTSGTFNEFGVSDNLEQNPSECEHFFMPLDLEGEYLACKHCGYVIKNNSFNQ